MDIKVIVALIGITGILLSAFVQYFLGSKSELRKKSIELRAQSYVDLIDAVAAIASRVRA
ncbi:hypothetical protein VV869_19005 [Photobacterium sp. MCCC 1A19761]|uniref:hypothetical protein n=1 Tax=Photobacterium sp. MCCC 1A19761 TaxID=3115000 RepID=UPI00307D4A1A